MTVQDNDGFQMRLEDIESYLASLAADHSKKTIARYRYLLRTFYDALPADKRIRKNTLAEWSAKAVDSYSPNYIDRVCGVCNAWLRYMGHGDYQMFGPKAVSLGAGKEITRGEYLHLLDTAKFFGREQAYLLAKVFATTGVSISELSRVTVEAVREGKVSSSGGDAVMPVCLVNELTSYAKGKGISAGPVFVARNGQPISMVRVSIILHGLGTAAGLVEGKSRPSTLQRLYRTTKEEAEAMAAETVERAMNEQADGEQKQFIAGRRMKDAGNSSCPKPN